MYYQKNNLCHSGGSADRQLVDNIDQRESAGETDNDMPDVVSDHRENGVNGEEAEDEDGEGNDSNANTGWAEAMAKILGKKTPDSKSSILLKNKELDKVKEKERQTQLERKKQVIATVTHTFFSVFKHSN